MFTVSNLNFYSCFPSKDSKDSKDCIEQVISKINPKRVNFDSKPHNVNIFEQIRENLYNRRGFDLKKNFCHKLTTKPVTLYFNNKEEDRKYGFRSASVRF